MKLLPISILKLWQTHIKKGKSPMSCTPLIDPTGSMEKIVFLLLQLRSDKKKNLILNAQLVPLNNLTHNFISQLVIVNLMNQK